MTLVQCKRTLLDYGSLSLEEYMGHDYTPVEAARVSTDQGRKGEKEDNGLTRFLLREKHTSPFEMIEVRFEVEAPIFVARQWVRHRTANWNERSLRYTEELNPKVYHPTHWRAQDKKNKQSSLSEGSISSDTNTSLSERYTEWVQQGFDLYTGMKKEGVANEMARLALPVGYYTKFWWKNDMHNTMKFLYEREHPMAQYEIRVYANAMHDMLRTYFPNLMRIYDEVISYD